MVHRIESLKKNVLSMFKDISVFCVEKNRMSDVRVSIEDAYTYVSFIINESFDDYCIFDDLFADDMLNDSFSIFLDQRKSYNKPELGLRKVKVRFRLNNIKISLPHKNTVYLYFSDDEVFEVEKDEIPQAWHTMNKEVDAFENGEFLVRGIYLISRYDSEGSPAFDLKLYNLTIFKANKIITDIEGKLVDLDDTTLPAQTEEKDDVILQNQIEEKNEIETDYEQIMATAEEKIERLRKLFKP